MEYIIKVKLGGKTFTPSNSIYATKAEAQYFVKLAKNVNPSFKGRYKIVSYR
jgi:hypothetical protein